MSWLSKTVKASKQFISPERFMQTITNPKRFVKDVMVANPVGALATYQAYKGEPKAAPPPVAPAQQQQMAREQQMQEYMAQQPQLGGQYREQQQQQFREQFGQQPLGRYSGLQQQQAGFPQYQQGAYPQQGLLQGVYPQQDFQRFQGGYQANYGQQPYSGLRNF